MNIACSVFYQMLRLNHIPIWEDVLDLHVLQNLHLECVDFVAANVTVYGTVNGTSSVNVLCQCQWLYIKCQSHLSCR